MDHRIVHNGPDGGFVVGGMPDGKTVSVSNAEELDRELAKEPVRESVTDAGGAELVVLAFPGGTIKPGDRLAVMGQDGTESNVNCLLNAGADIPVVYLQDFGSESLNEIFGRPLMVSVFNRLKELA